MTEPAPLSKPRRRWRTIVVGWLIVLTLGVLSTPSVLHWQAVRAIEQRQLLSAERLVARWRWVAPWSQEAVALQLRVCRKLGDVALYETVEQQARRLGVVAERLERERWLLEVQAGVLNAGPARLTALLNDPRQDGREICEAFVNGYVLNYQVDEALVLIDAWRGDYPNDPMPWLVLGRIEEHRGNVERCAEHYQQALKTNPRFAPAAYNLARLKLTRTAVDDARRFYEQAAAALELPQPAQVGLAHCDRLQNRLDDAERRLEGVLATEPDRLALAYRLVGDTLETGQAAPWMERGQLELAQNKPAEAVKTFRDVLARHPQNQAIRFQLANALRASGFLEEAEREYARVRSAKVQLAQLTPILTRVRENPRDPQARAELGALFLQHLSEPQGLVWLRSALDLDPHCQAAHAALAGYYERAASTHADAAQRAAWHRQQLTGEQPTGPVDSSPSPAQPE